MDYGEKEFHKVCFFFEENCEVYSFFICLDGSSLFRAVSEDVRKKLINKLLVNNKNFLVIFNTSTSL